MQSKNQREIPKEVMFKLSDAVQDQIEKNKYWFEFPSQWANQLDKDPIIGIRSMYLTKTNRLINLEFTILISEDIPNQTPKTWLVRKGNLGFTLDGDVNIKNFTSKFNAIWFSNTIEDSTYRASDYKEMNYEWNSKDFAAWFDYDGDNKKTILHIGCSLQCPNSITVTDNNNQTHTCNFKIGFQALNNDTIAVLGTNNLVYGNREATIPIWTRYNCYIRSSLAEDDANGFLGHTRPVAYYPIKYYRLKNKNKKFWIKLYETKYHDVPVIIPVDYRDDLFIEAVVLFTSEGLL